MKKVEIFCDGACSGNPGPGGYGVIVRCNGDEKVFSDGFVKTTNNQMEMMAAIVGLESLTERSQVTVVTDSEYLVKGMTIWILGWLKRDWKNANRQPVKNRALWEKLLKLAQTHEVKWQWVRGHAGHPENERADALARAAIESFTKNPIKASDANGML